MESTNANSAPQQPATITTEQALQQAVANHKAGQLQDAERLYRAILQAHPNHPDANHNLGVLAIQVKQAAAALPYFKIALEANPNLEQYWLSYADALLATGQSADALNVIQNAIERGHATPAIQTLRQKTEAAAAHATSTSAKKVNTPTSKQSPEQKLLPQAEKNKIIALFNAERYVELESQTRALVEQYPDSGFAWKVLGASLHMQSKDAVSVFQKAVGLLPDDANAYFNLGVALQALGQLGQAVASYQRALEIKSDHDEAANNLSSVLKDLGRLVEVLTSLRKIVEIRPNSAEAHYNLGNALRDLGQLDEAVASYRQALEIKPDFAEAHNNLGNTLEDQGQLDDAVACYRCALEIKPDFAEAFSNLGHTLTSLGELDRAAENLRRALEIKPDFAEAHCNLGNALTDLRQLDGAVANLRRALQIKPDFAEAHNNLGNVLKGLGQLDDAVASYRRALEIKPDFAEAHNNLGNALTDQGLLDGAIASYRRALEIKPDFAEASSNLLFTHNYRSDQTTMEALAEARHFGDLVATRVLPYVDWYSIPEPNRRLRIGFVSADLRAHPVGYFLESMLAALTSHASTQIELVAYTNSFDTDAVTARIKAHCSEWHPVRGISDESLARKIRDDGIDILIDLSGHTAHNRLTMFARKPAPIQASWLGYFATTGVEAVDYLIADPWVVPKAEEAHFTETIARLPETYLCFTVPDLDVKINVLPALETNAITFGCFNHLAKMNPAVVALWARVLMAVPGSRLFLKTKQLNDATTRQSVMDRFAMHGIGPERLILEPSAPRAKLLAAYQHVDIALDPFPYPGGTTSIEALWMGVPVLTLAGDRFLSHIGESILHNAGLPDWIAVDADDYVARAVTHTQDLPRLSHLRSRLRQQVLKSPLFDAPRFAGHFEAALRDMWVQWCNQQPQQKL